FTMSKNAVGLGEKINFTNTSTHQKSCEWDFGDGTTATENDPQKSYTTAGTYVVKLTSYARGEKKRDITFATVQVGGGSSGATTIAFIGTTKVVNTNISNGNVFMSTSSSTNDYYSIYLSNSIPNKFYFNQWSGTINGTTLVIPDQTLQTTQSYSTNGGTTTTTSRQYSLTNASGTLLNNVLTINYTEREITNNSTSSNQDEITYTGTKL
ncbi:MAG: PKD domain-containing protein, partial [Bacteroidia bacterium]